MSGIERQYSVPTCRNLLRKPLVFGVPAAGLLFLASMVLGLYVVSGGSSRGNLLSVGIGFAGYIVLRLFQRWARTGWEEVLVYRIERLINRKKPVRTFALENADLAPTSPDTMSDSGLIAEKEGIIEVLNDLTSGERMAWICQISESGAEIRRISPTSKVGSVRGSAEQLTKGLWKNEFRHYSLYRLPVKTDPKWLFGTLSKLKLPFDVVFTAQGIDGQQIKRRLELSRRSNAGSGKRLSDIDADVTFEESSLILEGLSRGEQKVIEISLSVVGPNELSLDPEFFCEERERDLSAASLLGLRKRPFRSHLVTLPTASDLFPNILDPREPGRAILKTLRGFPLYFSPNDSRLEALHWLVVGASGSGKSFFTGLVLKRMIEAGEPLSVLFVDHNRSFRRLVRASTGLYGEPQTLQELDSLRVPIFDALNIVGSISGVELSDLPMEQKKLGAQYILGAIETFLRARDTTHPIYVVLDECWNFMRDEPVLVQRAFREFRKLNGAVVAITQSLSDFLTDQSGQSIFQNASIRILLRQGEDVARYQGILGLNEVELARVKRLKQRKGRYSECLLQTPFLSRLGRLYPTDEEHALLRTDNLREELIQEARRSKTERMAARVC